MTKTIICSQPACSRRVYGCGRCQFHYLRWLRSVADTDEGRFWARVDKNGPVPAHRPDLGPCWVWMGNTNYGYGIVVVDGERLRAHRVALEYVGRPVPHGLVPDHLCANPPCVNPNHLEAVTHAENIRRGYELKNVTRCRRGHAFDEANTYFYADGRRQCRRCLYLGNHAGRIRRHSAAVAAADPVRFLGWTLADIVATAGFCWMANAALAGVIRADMERTLRTRNARLALQARRGREEAA